MLVFRKNNFTFWDSDIHLEHTYIHAYIHEILACKSKFCIFYHGTVGSFSLQNNWWRWWREDFRSFQIGNVPFNTRAGKRWSPQRAIHRAPTRPGDAVPWLSRPEETVTVDASSTALRRRRTAKPAGGNSRVSQPGTTGSSRRWKRRRRGRWHRILRFLNDWFRNMDNVRHQNQLIIFITYKGLIIPHISYQFYCCLFGFTNTKQLQVCEDVLHFSNNRTKSFSHNTSEKFWIYFFHLELLVIRLPTWIFYFSDFLHLKIIQQFGIPQVSWKYEEDTSLHKCL